MAVGWMTKGCPDRSLAFGLKAGNMPLNLLALNSLELISEEEISAI
jgi:hypothetical protein